MEDEADDELVFEGDNSFHKRDDRFCDVCGIRDSTRNWFGRMLCMECLESEMEDDHTVPED